MLKSIFIDHQRLSRKKCNIRNCNLKFVVNIDIQQMSIGIGKKYYRKGMIIIFTKSRIISTTMADPVSFHCYYFWHKPRPRNNSIFVALRIYLSLIFFLVQFAQVGRAFFFKLRLVE